jgi:Ca2+-dependent lipid-binding protein
MDSTGKGCDPYGVMTFASGGRVLSKTVKNSLNPTWDEEMRLPIILPSLSDKISISVWDYDRLSEDELVGQFHMSLRDLNDAPGKFFFFFLEK